MIELLPYLRRLYVLAAYEGWAPVKETDARCQACELLISVDNIRFHVCSSQHKGWQKDGQAVNGDLIIRSSPAHDIRREHPRNL